MGERWPSPKPPAAVRGVTLRLTLPGVGAMNSPRFTPAGLLLRYGKLRVAFDGGTGAEPPALDWTIDPALRAYAQEPGRLAGLARRRRPSHAVGWSFGERVRQPEAGLRGRGDGRGRGAVRPHRSRVVRVGPTVAGSPRAARCGFGSADGRAVVLAGDALVAVQLVSPGPEGVAGAVRGVLDDDLHVVLPQSFVSNTSKPSTVPVTQRLIHAGAVPPAIGAAVAAQALVSVRSAVPQSVWKLPCRSKRR